MREGPQDRQKPKSRKPLKAVRTSIFRKDRIKFGDIRYIGVKDLGDHEPACHIVRSCFRMIRLYHIQAECGVITEDVPDAIPEGAAACGDVRQEHRMFGKEAVVIFAGHLVEG